MFSKKDILNIAFRQWKGESLKAIALDYNPPPEIIEATAEREQSRVHIS